jgi:hypothetical protein
LTHLLTFHVGGVVLVAAVTLVGIRLRSQAA